MEHNMTNHTLFDVRFCCYDNAAFRKPFLPFAMRQDFHALHVHKRSVLKLIRGRIMEEWPEFPSSKPIVIGPTGTANEGKIGPAIGKVDIGANARAYFCQVALAGVNGKLGGMKCGIRDDGRVKIDGGVTGANLPIDPNEVFEKRIQELCPPGSFSISFNLPGPVDPRLTSLNYKNGILEVTVMKYTIPYFPEANHCFPSS